jgi:hypothetical protein
MNEKEFLKEMIKDLERLIEYQIRFDFYVSPVFSELIGKYKAKLFVLELKK